MLFREASLIDIPQMQVIRNSVKENVLSNPALVTEEDYKTYLTIYGKGWICEIENEVIAFAIVDLKGQNVWALFVQPGYEERGIGKELHRLMLDWYFAQTTATLWLSTAFHTRAETFYRKQGWTEAGLHSTKEIRFEITADDWRRFRKNKD